MPQINNFQHAQYSRSNPGERVSYPTFEPEDPIGSPAWKEAMAKVGTQLARSQVKGVLFMNGHPFSDVFGAARLDEVGGLKRGYSRGISGLESLLALLRPATNGIGKSEDPIHLPLPMVNRPTMRWIILPKKSGILRRHISKNSRRVFPKKGVKLFLVVDMCGPPFIIMWEG